MVAANAGDDARQRGELSEADADRFASAYRPSWHSQLPGPLDPEQRATAPAVAARAPSPEKTQRSLDSEREPDVGGVNLETHEDAAAVAALTSGRLRRRAMMIIGGASVAFAALVALAVVASTGTPAPEPVLATGADTAHATPSPIQAAPASATSGEAKAGDPATLVDAHGEDADPANAPTPQVPADSAETIALAEPSAADATSETGGTDAPAVDPGGVSPQEATPAAAAETPTPALPEPEVESAPEQVDVRIAASPSRATLMVDGRRVKNPYEDALPSGGSLEVTAAAAGYRPRTMTLQLDRDRTLALKLEREAKARRKARKRRKSDQQAKASPRVHTPAAKRPAGAGFVSESPY